MAHLVPPVLMPMNPNKNLIQKDSYSDTSSYKHTITHKHTHNHAMVYRDIKYLALLYRGGDT